MPLNFTPVIGFGLAAMLALVLCAPAPAAESDTAGSSQFLIISDLHFDPMADPKLVDRLAAVEPEGWQAVFDSSSERSLGRYGRDSNWPLLQSALRQMKETLPVPAFVLVPGDFLAHNFRREFDAAAGDHSDAAYRMFVRKTMQFLALQLEQSFPDVPILPALGNNDEVCGDYQLQPGGPFSPIHCRSFARSSGASASPVSIGIGRATEITAWQCTACE